MLNKAKKRYISIMSGLRESDALNVISRRCSELFGEIALEKAELKVIKSRNNVAVVRCNLDQLDRILISIALANPAMIAIGLSGSIRRLTKELSESGNNPSGSGH